MSKKLYKDDCSPEMVWAAVFGAEYSWLYHHKDFSGMPMDSLVIESARLANDAIDDIKQIIERDPLGCNFDDDGVIDAERRKNMKESKMKTLKNSDISGARQNVKDIEVFGNGDMFQLLCKASSKAEGWMKSTKAMEIDGVGCVVQVTTQQGDHVADAVCFVPCVHIVDDVNSGSVGRRLERGHRV